MLSSKGYQCVLNADTVLNSYWPREVFSVFYYAVIAPFVPTRLIWKYFIFVAFPVKNTQGNIPAEVLYLSGAQEL